MLSNCVFLCVLFPTVLISAKIIKFPFYLLQYWLVGCKVSGNLSEQVFLLDLGFAIINILNYNGEIKHCHIVNYDLVVVKIVVKKFGIDEIFCNSLLYRKLGP